jgi:HSP20 family protein
MAFRPFQDPQISLGNLQDEFNRLVERVWHAGVSTGPLDGQEWAPVVDLYEHDEGYVLYAEVPGVEANEIDITQTGNTLTIRGEKRRPSGVADKERGIRRERRYGAFCRSVELPPGIDGDRLSARCTGGVLEITLPKKEAYKPKSVRIKVDEPKASK